MSGGRRRAPWAARWLFPEHGAYARLAPLLLVLTFTSGLVDAVSFLSLGRVFVANMTGNVAFLGFALAGFAELSAPASATALGSFVAGAVAAGRWPRAAREGGLLARLVAVQAALVGSALMCLVTGGGRYAVLVPLAVGMGLQNGVARRLAVPDLTTTVVTRTLTGLAAARRAPEAVRRAASVGLVLLGAYTGGLLHGGPGPGWALGVVLLLLAGVALAAMRVDPPPG
ncbi:YoaK family protein [Streptomyces sp. NPDC057011]|uniref:YoaK family protein n=1 Tax=unclassified Streptomyces TaxID=2593676 RepID=UPI003628F39B